MTASHSPNLPEELKQQLQSLVPAAFKDGQLDTDALRQLLGVEATARDERYGLNWAGKADSYKALQYPTSATLRPRIDQSVDFEHAQHVFIEGENLEVLKTLQRAYFGKVKMIYIDPPYNTGSDSFIYPDRFQESREDYLKRIESLDIDGNITKEGLFRKNSKDNGHYHSNWLSMMLPRLYLARNLLRDDGVIFISIDDNEQSNLKLLCDEIFGAENFVAQFVWKSRQNKDNRSITGVSTDHEYIFCYSKNSEVRSLKGSERKIDSYSNPDNDERGKWASGNMVGLLSADLRPNCHYELTNPETGINYGKPKMGWRYDKNTMQRLIQENRIIWPSVADGRPRRKVFLNELSTELAGFSSIIGENIYTRHGTAEIESLFNNRYFDFPKPSDLLKNLIQQVTNNNEHSVILDFFAGSGTTAQAVMEMNLEDDGSRQFICVQMPEPTDENSETYKAGYSTIADISRERIRRVISRIRQNADLVSPVKENDPNLGFRAFELAPSNFKQWRGDWAETEEELDKQLALMLPTEKRGASSLDMAFELLLKNGRPLISRVELKTIVETPVYIVWSQEVEEKTVALIFVLESMQLEALQTMLALKPKHMVFMDSVFNSNDSVKVNVALQCESAGVKFSSI